MPLNEHSPAVTANLRFDTDPKQRGSAPLFGAGQARRWASCGNATGASNIVTLA